MGISIKDPIIIHSFLIIGGSKRSIITEYEKGAPKMYNKN